MANKITFIPTNDQAELLIPAPKPAKQYIPEWYKHTPGINSKNVKVDFDGFPNPNVKNCIPFLDSLVSGYIQESWTDMYIDLKGNDIVYNFAGKGAPQMMSHRGGEHLSLPVTEYYYEFEFIWKQYWIPKLPDGYSYLFTHPFNRLDLPFTTATAIVDGDKLHYSNVGNVPVYIKKNFTGVIPVGTPLYQIIPFKRDAWKMDTEKYDEKKVKKGIHDLRKYFVGSYKKNFWQKKEYN